MPRLSLVLPMFNAGAAVPGRLAEGLRELDGQMAGDYQVIVVDDGSTDDSAALVEALAHPAVHLIRRPANGGKFAALRDGVAAADGEASGFTDIDIPYDLSVLPHAIGLVTEQGFHLAIGDRTLPQSSDASHESKGRHLASRVFAWFVRILGTGGVFDTQCGLKVFRSDTGRALFEATKENGFAGDVEILYLALKHNLAIRRVPVQLVSTGDSSVRMLKDSFKMLGALVRIVSRWRMGRYRSPELVQLSQQRWQPEERCV